MADLMPAAPDAQPPSHNRWHVDPKTCPHSNDDICPFCDFDDYYAITYPDCPWRDEVDV